MALAKQILPISFGQGIDTKIDPKQQVIGKLNLAQNAIFETLLSAKKRNGYDSILLQTTNNEDITTAKILSKFKNELILFDINKLYSFSDTLQKMQEKGTIYSVFPKSTPVLNNDYNHDKVDSIILENIKVFVYHNTILNDIRYSVVDNETGSLIVSNDIVEASCENVRVINNQNFVYIVYSSGTSLKYRRFNIFNPSNLQAAVLITNDVNSSNAKIDVDSSNDKIIVAYNSTVIGAELRLFPINSDGTIGTIIGITGANPSNALNVYITDMTNIIISFANSTSAQYTIFPFNLNAALLSLTTIETISNIANIDCIELNSSEYQFVYEISAADSVNHYIKKNTGNFSGTIGVPAVFLRSVGLCSKQFYHEDNIYIGLSFDTNLQSTYFFSDNSGTIVTKVSPSLGGGHVLNGVLPKINIISDDKFLFTSQIKGKNSSENGVFFSLLGINSTILDFNLKDPYQNELLADNLHIAGGILQMYDGDEVVEHGFHVYPEILTAGATATTGGFISNGNYSYIALYKWVDNYGHEHRSVPSLSLDVILSGGTSAQTQTIAIPTLRLTNKENVVIELYRTENNGTIYYKTSSVTTPNFNNKSVDTINIVDTTSDSDLISREILYTTGGVLDNTAASSCSLIATHTASNRLFTAGLENSNMLQYSKIQLSGLPVEFNDTQTILVDPVGGPISAIISMDEKLIIFEEDAIFYISGSGPNNLGQQNNFSEPERITNDVGCIDARSVVLIPSGLMFKSRKGIFFLNRGLTVEYIGAPVERYNDLSITSAKVIGEFNQVRFTTSDGDCLVYNYNLNLWSTFTNHEAKSAEVLNNDYYYIRNDNELFKENRQSFSDNGSPIKLLLETGWMSFNQLQGFQRVYKMLILGDYKSDHKLKVRFAYDFNNSFIQEKVIDPLDFINNLAYGEESPYGSGSPYGSSGNVYQARVDLQKQKCQTIKVRIEDQQEVAGEGFSLSAITLQLGGKEGLFKVNSNKKFGSS